MVHNGEILRIVEREINIRKANKIVHIIKGMSDTELKSYKDKLLKSINQDKKELLK